MLQAGNRVSNAKLWHALRDQAFAWRETDVVQRFARELPRNAGSRSSGLPGLLQHAHAAAAALMSRPMRYASALDMVADVVPEVDRDVLRDGHGQWLDAAGRVETAHRLTVAWLRSRLPGYPRLPAPQLAPGTPLTTDEFTHRLVWTPDERANGLQFQDAPPDVAAVLQAMRRDADIAQAARNVAAALVTTSEWEGLELARAALDEPGRHDLREVRRRLRDLLSPAAVDHYEPTLAFRRAEYREGVTAQEVDGLAGSAAEYASAFGAANALIESAASDVFGELTCYGIDTFEPADVETSPGRPPTVAFTVADPREWPEPGVLAWLDDPLVADAVHITSVQVQFQNVGSVTIRAAADVLSGTSDVWR